MTIIGLTGSVGMGKSVLARQFTRLGIPVHDADAAVHRLLGKGGLAVDAIKKTFPAAYIHGSVNRKVLGGIVFSDKTAKAKLESILHPLVRADRKSFLQNAQRNGHKIAVIDVPLLFEIGLYKAVDHILCVTAPAHVQADRVLKRTGMTKERLEAIRAAQWPDAKKQAHSHTVINTAQGYHASLKAVKQLVNALQTPKPVQEKPVKTPTKKRINITS